MIKIDYITDLKDFTKEEHDYLQDNGIILDDWDYILMMDYDRKIFQADNRPRDVQLERLLTGCCANNWYRIEFRGGQKIIGIAYHS